MICISGIPASGKSTVCNRLSELGFKCLHLSQIAERLGCIKSGDVDIDCVRENVTGEDIIVESHFSHLLKCDYTIILETDTNDARRRMASRNYDREKIDENIDSYLADVIYYEALERLPSVRIYRVFSEEGKLDEIVNKIVSLLHSFGLKGNW
jgi:adenylate kinase